jgi:exopolyphosphatase/guanosine-5'-triphosphate,3'-diphosphate pyrophosphatase
LHLLRVGSSPFIIFDLGGGTTEFVFGHRHGRAVWSIPLGALILTQRFLKSDPPTQEQLEGLSTHIARKLEEEIAPAFHEREPVHLVGTGGTATTLAAMLNDIPCGEISPERINGLRLRQPELKGLFSKMTTMTLSERSRLTGLDSGRASVIVAGTLITLRILAFFKELLVTVSMADLLEGVLIESLDGE